MRTGSRRLIGILAALALVMTACVVDTTDPSPPGNTTPPQPDPPQGVLASTALVTFDACDTFLDYVIGHAVDLVGPYGLEDGNFYPWWGREEAFFEISESLDAAAPATAGASRAFSTTNVQVVGVDEPDMVKTDGERIVTLSAGTLIVTDVTGDEPRVVGRLSLGNHSVQSLFLSGDTVLLFGSSWTIGYPVIEGDVDYLPSYQTPTVQLIEVDISGEPEVVRTMSIDGRFVSARMVGDTVRLVSTSGPVGFEWSYPSGTGLRAERKAIEENQEIVRNSTADNWIPYYIVTDSDGDVVSEGTLFDCDRASHPEEFSGINMLSVATIDLGKGLEVVDATGLLATGETIYASPDSLYVATQNWEAFSRALEGEVAVANGVTTEIHKFDISSETRTEYVASGTVEGYLLNQFAMDEHEGMLRVASTTSPAWWGEGFESESMVTVLRDIGTALVEIGKVDGLGETEQIYSVRFMGDTAYVVTFRQTDPLYTIDLSDPRRPKMVGELKILGYSAYLHPVGEGLIVGVGQDATEEGRIQGTQVSLFDVSDLTDPVRIDQITLDEGSSSQVEYDHHAFLYWEPTGLTMIPVQQWWWDEKSESAFFGVVGLSVEDDQLDEIRRFAHPGGEDNWDHSASILRSIVIGESVYTVSHKGIMKSEVDSLDEEAWLGF